jgi:hypothetical protein
MLLLVRLLLIVQLRIDAFVLLAAFVTTLKPWQTLTSDGDFDRNATKVEMTIDDAMERRKCIF